MPWSMNEVELDLLSREGIELLNLEKDELYVVLGCQLLGSAPPARGASIATSVTRLTRTLEDASEADKLSNQAADLCSGFKEDGLRFVSTMKDEFRKGLCNDTVRDLTTEINESKMQVLIMIISAILKMPPQLEAISVTLAALFCKSKLTEICQ
jgi:hypothetical protein